MGRGWAAIAVLLLLAACTGRDAARPCAETRTPPTLGARFYPPEGWGWGLIQLGDAPPQRYGVGAPATAMRAQVLILPDYGESAETWFETAADLNARGYGVWVLDGSGQGGSGRLTGPRDLGYLRSFNPDAAAVRAIIATVIRPPKDTPLFILGEGVGAMVAVRAGERPLAAQGMILSSPALDERPGGAMTDFEVLLGGRRRALGGHAWRRDAGDPFTWGGTHDPWRGRAPRLWQAANPDLRVGDPSVAWVSAYNLSARLARDDLKSLQAPTLVLEPAKGARGCRDLPHCEAHVLADAGPMLELERDAVRQAWLADIDAFIRARLAPAPAATSAPRPSRPG
ncbi:serine aminopeptidase domain-containing protein [Caulobacter sp. KR2-114]|uniref:serine aminopeptidase domain-containing protein n=1 Tax=Caulobacter sp. KR2-114 TaxID=3400912 RepID=UPI003BFB3935